MVKGAMALMTRRQLRAARALLVLRQELLAEKARIGVATLRRYENGNAVGQEIVEALQGAIEKQGVVFVAAGDVVDGRVVGGGVFLKVDRELPSDTLERLAALDRTSEEAEELLPPDARGKVGRRSRVSPSRAGPRLKGRKPVDASDAS